LSDRRIQWWHYKTYLCPMTQVLILQCFYFIWRT
jgi:hypothetical protein